MSIESCFICAALIDTDKDDRTYDYNERPRCAAHRCDYPNCGCRNDGPNGRFQCRFANDRSAES